MCFGSPIDIAMCARFAGGAIPAFAATALFFGSKRLIWDELARRGSTPEAASTIEGPSETPSSTATSPAHSKAPTTTDCVPRAVENVAGARKLPSPFPRYTYTRP